MCIRDRDKGDEERLTVNDRRNGEKLVRCLYRPTPYLISYVKRISLNHHIRICAIILISRFRFLNYCNQCREKFLYCRVF